VTPRSTPRLWLPTLLVAGALLACGDRRPPLVFSPAELPEAQVGQSYSATISVSGNVTPVGDLFVEAGTLPAGLELTFNQGSDRAEVSGTPTDAGTAKFTLGAWCFGTNVSGQTGQQDYELVVK
jgi:putative Ig domain-containing protein